MRNSCAATVCGVPMGMDRTTSNYLRGSKQPRIETTTPASSVSKKEASFPDALFFKEEDDDECEDDSKHPMRFKRYPRLGSYEVTPFKTRYVKILWAIRPAKAQ